MTRRHLLACALALTTAAGCHRPVAQDAETEARRPALTSFAPRAMISSTDVRASEAGIEILRAGGNAVDAAVAVGFVLAVTYPEAGNLGGGGFMVIRLADGTDAALDYREMAPMRATRDMYVGPDGSVTRASVVGHLAVGVPGSVAGMAEAHRRFGRLPFAQLLQPAIRLAEAGFTVDSALARSLTEHQALIARFDGRHVFLPGGRPLPQGSVLRQPELARTLRMIAEQGPHAFYQGEIAGMIAREMERGGGLITREDLARYRPIWREPVRSRYREYTLLGMPPVSSGGLAMAQIFNMLETRPQLPPHGSAAHYHLVTELFKRAFVDRNTLVGDPAFVDIPLERLTSPEYARQIMADFSPDRTTPVPPRPRPVVEGFHTTHYSVADADGSVVATTTTINDLYGSGVFVREGGFFLNDEMDDFTARPGVPNLWGLVQGDANAIAPGKRMLSSMTPTIVLDANGAPLLIVGARGGPRIITGTAQIVMNVLAHGMTLADAMAAGRIHHQAWPDTIMYERGVLGARMIDSLTAMGHGVREASFLVGSAHAVMRVGGGWIGVVDPRTTGGAVGY